MVQAASRTQRTTPAPTEPGNAASRRTADVHTRDYARHDLFYSAELPPRALFVLVDGRVAVYRTTYEGKRLVTEILQPGDVFGDLSLAGGDHGTEAAEALSDCRVMELDHDAVAQLITADPEWAFRLLSAAARRLRGASERVEEFAYSTVEARVASAILRVSSAKGGEVAVSHQEIADMAGTYRETATRVLGDLQSRQLLKLSRCAIEVRDPAALAAVARRIPISPAG